MTGMKNARSNTDRAFSPGGDGGNRTRVRKTRPADIYERSRSLVLILETEAGRTVRGPAAGTRKPLFRAVSGVARGTLTLCRPLHRRSEGGVGGRDPEGSLRLQLTLGGERKSGVRSAVGT